MRDTEIQEDGLFSGMVFEGCVGAHHVRVQNVPGFCLPSFFRIPIIPPNFQHNARQLYRKSGLPFRPPEFILFPLTYAAPRVSRFLRSACGRPSPQTPCTPPQSARRNPREPPLPPSSLSIPALSMLLFLCQIPRDAAHVYALAAARRFHAPVGNHRIDRRARHAHDARGRGFIHAFAVFGDQRLFRGLAA